MDEFSSRTARLIGEEAVNRLANCKIALFGVGGVGSFAAEALARAGVGFITLVDADEVAPSNLNRQLVALHSTLGQPKVEVMAQRIRDIRPETHVEPLQIFYLPENAEQIDLSRYDFILDAIDTVTAKVELIVRASQAGVPIASCMGAGNKLDPTQFRVEDLFKTSVCPLCKVMRKELKARGISRLPVVYSQEPPQKPILDPAHPETSKKIAPGSISFVPPVAGMILASIALRACASPAS